MQKPLWWIKWTKYEYWPVWFFFLPGIFIFWPLLAIRARAFLYFTATNPGIPLGGFFGEEKYDIIQPIPAEYLPASILLTRKQFEGAIQQMATHRLTFPIIAKPNVGERGTGVKKIENETQLQAYLYASTDAVILQEYITLPEEYGVIFYRFPDDSAKGITSIVKKRFLKVTGDGKSTVCQLLQKNERARFQLKDLAADPSVNLNEVLPAGTEKLVQPIGNHCKGTAFLNANHLVTNELIAAFEDISRTMPGFYFGRFDIKAAGDEELKKGQTIKIMEVNGTTSEPGHIYDMSTMNLLTAYRDVWRNMKIINSIGISNHRRGVKYTPIPLFLSTLYHHFFKR